jgi:2-C-methyl-D-erythritol 2,4-cyclodiphosphate synthase
VTREIRVGLGIDAHRFAPERPLILGGVRLREHDGLAGHSDADALTHAVMDALLGAAGLEDIGHYFPDTDPALAGADSLELLGRVAQMVRRAGWRPVNVDAVVVCEEPRIAPVREAMRNALAEAAGLTPGQVGVRGTTTEGLGFPGRREGILVQAVALVERILD